MIVTTTLLTLHLLPAFTYIPESLVMCESIECTAPFDLEEELRRDFVQYVENLYIRGYRLWRHGWNDYYDCTGIIYSFFKDKVDIPRTTTWHMYWYGLRFGFVHPTEAKPGDLLVWIKKEWGDRPNHTATINRYVGPNQVEIIDHWQRNINKTSPTKRIVPINYKHHKGYIIRNPYIQMMLWEDVYIPTKAHGKTHSRG